MTQLSTLPYTVRPCTAADYAAILDLLKATVGETDSSLKTEGFWRWKHLQSPFGASYSVCAFDEVADVLVGLRTVMWWDFRDPSNSQLWRGARPVDTATHPDYQRKGIFSALTRFSLSDLARQGASFIFNTPNDNSLPGYLKLGWTVVARWPLYARPCRPFRVPWEIARGKVGLVRDDSSRSGILTWAEFIRIHGDEVEGVVLQNESNRVSTGYRTVRDLKYLDWRYGSHPDLVYCVAPTVRKNRLEGFLIGRRARSQRGIDSFVITEIFSTDSTVAGIAVVLRNGLRVIPEVYAVCHASVGSNEKKALDRVGFFRLPRRGFTFTSLPLGPLRRGRDS